MAKYSGAEILSFFNNNKMLIITALITVVNLYIASLLTPLKTDIRELNIQVVATSEKLDEHIENTHDLELIPTQLTEINHRLSRIEKQLGIEF